MATVDTYGPVASLENVGLRYGLGSEVLRDVSLTLSAGSFHFLTGQSGSGKSSLLSLLYLARRPTRGVVRLFGRDAARLKRHERPEMRRRIGVVFQDFRLLEHLSALDNVALPLRLVGGTEDKVIREHVVELLHWVGLGARVDALPGTLSGGEKQRIAIARAVISRPRLLLADEPTGNVDDEVAMRLMYLLEELNRLGTTVLIATHNRDLVKRFDHPEIRLGAAAPARSRAARA